MSYAFVENGLVDITGKTPAVFEKTGWKVQYRGGEEITVRGTYKVMDAMTKDDLEKAPGEGGEALRSIFSKFPASSGYKQWVFVTFPDGQEQWFVSQENSLVAVFSGFVYKKPWYSR